MAQQNLLTCGSVAGNMGKPTCIHNPALIIGAILVPKGTILDAADLADIQTVMQAGTVNATYSSRWHIIGKFKEFNDNSDQRQQKTWGFGEKTTTREAVYNWEFTYYDSMCMHKNLLKFKYRHNQYDVFFIDSKNNMIGTEVVANAALGNVGFAGVSLTEFHVDNWKPATGSDPAMYKCSFDIEDASQLNEYYSFAQLPFSPLKEILQVSDVRIEQLVAPDASGTFTISLYTGCGSENLVTKLGSSIANTARFKCLNRETGGTITVSTVTVSGSGNSNVLVVDVDSSDADYPASGDEFTIELVDVATLFSAVGLYLESNVLTLKAA